MAALPVILGKVSDQKGYYPAVDQVPRSGPHDSTERGVWSPRQQSLRLDSTKGLQNHEEL